MLKNNKSFSSKIVKDFNSNISCLPGNFINSEQKEKLRMTSTKRFENNDIFNVNYSNNQNNNNHNVIYNSFNVSNSKSKIFETSNNEKRLIENPKSKRPDFIRNPFSSQITIK